jgi:hypothetical protein
LRVNIKATVDKRFNMAKNHVKLCLVILNSLFTPIFAYATEPLLDQVQIGGQYGQLRFSERGWLPLPPSEKLHEIRRAERCSAFGGPRGIYRLEADHLWLVELYRCRGGIPLGEVYPEVQGPLLAKWITGDLVMDTGHDICRSSTRRDYIKAYSIEFKVQSGVLLSLVRRSNLGHPDCEKPS